MSALEVERALERILKSRRAVGKEVVVCGADSWVETREVRSLGVSLQLVPLFILLQELGCVLQMALWCPRVFRRIPTFPGNKVPQGFLFSTHSLMV